MSAINAEIRSLASEVAASFESQSSSAATTHRRSNNNNSALHHTNNNASLPSSITLYRTGRILYSCHSSSIGGSNDNGRENVLINSFEDMMASLPSTYVHDMLLHNLHHAYASLIISYSTSPSSISTSSTVTSALSSMLGKPHPAIISSHSWKDIQEGTESLCGIYLSSVIACQCCCCCCCCMSLSLEEGRHELKVAFVSLSWVYDYLLSNNNDAATNREAGGKSMQKLILKTLSRMLVHGAVVIGSADGKSSEQDVDEQLSSIMTLIQNIQSALGEYNCALGDMLDMSEKELGEPSFVEALRSKFQTKNESPPQLQYLLAMLRSSPKSNNGTKATLSSSNVNSASTLKPEPSQQQQSEPQQQQRNMTDIQIDHIKSVLPSLGEGYIEEALKCYNHDVERTLEALLQVVSEDSNNHTTTIHPRLLTLPTNLPRKLKESVDKYSANVNLHRGASVKNDGREFATIQKAHFKKVEQQAEEEAFLIDNVARNLGGLRVSQQETEGGANNDDTNDPFTSPTMRDEYNDDYDDQYDGIGSDGGIAGGIGGMDEGLYDVDIHNVHQKYDRGGAKNEQEMWRKYNAVIKDVDRESQFWEDNRNLNRGGGGGKVVRGKKKAEEEHQDDDAGEEGGDGKKYRGPDKGKGGRLIGPDGKYLPIKRGGKKGRGGGGGGGGAGSGPGSGRGNAGRGAGRGGRGGKGGRGGGGGGGGGAGKGGSSAKGESKTNQGDNSEMSKIQKRRKNDNKSKIGNHHRKDRATKKAAGGMVLG